MASFCILNANHYYSYYFNLYFFFSGIMLKTILIALMATLMLLSGTLTANEINPLATSAQLRFGYITTEPSIGPHESTLAMGGRFGLLMPVSDEVGAGVSFYSTNALLGEDDNRSFL
ncbi:MAG: hypothetical protein KAG20_11075, partial [Cocleimonas sp.]|nr:hypothetical protein [Cocleimonas sp.]